jgi:hypothetical protein
VLLKWILVELEVNEIEAIQDHVHWQDMTRTVLNQQGSITTKVINHLLFAIK